MPPSSLGHMRLCSAAGASLILVCVGAVHWDTGTSGAETAGTGTSAGRKASRQEAPHIHTVLAPHPNASHNIQQPLDTLHWNITIILITEHAEVTAMLQNESGKAQFRTQFQKTGKLRLYTTILFYIWAHTKREFTVKQGQGGIFKGHLMMWSITVQKACGKLHYPVQINAMRVFSPVKAYPHRKIFGPNAITSRVDAVQHQTTQSWHPSLWKDSRSPLGTECRPEPKWHELTHTEMAEQDQAASPAPSRTCHNLALVSLSIVNIENETGHETSTGMSMLFIWLPLQLCTTWKA